jgi:hypothetical protein
MQCHDPVDGRLLKGWLCCPDGKRIVAMCHGHAQHCIDKYREKLGEQWTFEHDAH